MTFPITPNPAIHNLSPQDLTNTTNAAANQLKNIFGQLPTIILKQVIAFIKQESGIDLSGFLTLLNGLGGASGMVGELSDFLPDLEKALDGIDITDPGSILTAIENAVIGIGSDLGGIVLGLFGITPGADPASDLSALGAQLMSLLGNPSFSTGGGFDPIAAAEQMLQSVLTPAGALSTFTQLPAHLFAGLNIGGASVNFFPDGSFDDASTLDGLSMWTWSSDGRLKPGSAWTTGAGLLRQLIGVPIPAVPGDITMLSTYAKWNGVSATTGNAITLCCNAYDASDVIISDPTNRVIKAIATPGATSTGFSGADAHGWVALTGTYQAPAGTSYVRMCLEVESVVNAGNIGFDDCVQTLKTGVLDASLLKNMENAPTTFLNTVEGFLGLNNQNDTFQHLLDGLGSAYHPSGSVSGLDFTDLFALAQGSTTNAITAALQSALNTVTLGQRTNKSVAHGMNPTSVASFPISAFTATSTLAAGSAIGQVIRPPEVATQGFLQFLASGASSDVRVNLFNVNPTTNVKTALWNSGNIASTITATFAHVRALIPGLSQPTVNPGDHLLAEIVNNGSSALTIGTAALGLPNDVNEPAITNFGFTRAVSAGGASPTSLTSGQGAYGATVPQITLGILAVPANYHVPEPHPYTAAGSNTLAVPSWMMTGDLIDAIGIGGGGGGGASFFVISGQGGGPAAWGASTLVYGVDVKLGSSLTVVVGGRGSAGTGGSDGGNGGNTTVTYIDPSNVSHTITFTGGPLGTAGVNPNNPLNPSGLGNALGATNETWNAITYFGGPGVSTGATGQSPGGGGGGAISYLNGASGGVGEADIVFRQP